MGYYTYRAWPVNDANDYLSEFRRGNMSSRYNKETRQQLLKDVPRFMQNTDIDRYAYFLLVYNAPETSKQEKRKATDIIDELIDKDFIPAYNAYGTLLEEGLFYDKDDALAYYWYDLASKDNFLIGRYNLGRCLIRGIGCKKDVALGQKYVLEAANKEVLAALRFIANGYYYGKDGYPQDYYQAREWAEKAAKQWHPHDCLFAANIYLSGKGGPVDNKKAASWFEVGAWFDDVTCQKTFAKMCYNGTGVDVDYDKAFAYFKLASEQDDVDSMVLLGLCYLSGKGCFIDKDKGKYWLTKASNRGNETAKKALMGL